MRVLHFYKTSFPDSSGGVEQVIHQLARSGHKHGIQTDVLSLSNNDKHSTEYDGYRIHRAKLNFQIASTGFSASVFWYFLKLAKQADVIHYHFPWPFMDVVHFLTRVKKPSVLTYHSDIVKQKHLLKLYRPLKHRFLSSVDRIVATSPNYVKTSATLNRFSHKVSIIPIGLDKNAYPIIDSQKKNYWRKVLGDKFFLFVGVLRYYKGLHILLEAAALVNFPIVIVGAGPIEQELKTRAAQLGLSHLRFLGYLSEEDKTVLFTLSYGVVFPSHLRSEAFGVSLLEGAMYGKPLISCEIGTGTSFVNIDNASGLVVPSNHPEALAKAMRFLWDNPNEAKQMGTRAEMRYQQFFTADTMIKSYAELYDEICNQGAPCKIK